MFDAEQDLGRLTCDKAIVFPVYAGFSSSLHGLSINRSNGQNLVAARGLRLSSDNPSINNVVAQYMGDVDVDLNEDGHKRHAFSFDVKAEDGSRMFAEGLGNINKIELNIGFDSFFVEDLGVKMRISGEQAVVLFPLSKRIDMTVDGQLQDLTFTHSALSTEPIGPISLKIGGQFSAELVNLTTREMTVDWVEGLIKMEDVPVDFEMHLSTQQGSRSFLLKANVEEMDAADVVDAIPSGLMPHVMPIEATGPFNMTIDVDVREPNYSNLT